MQLYRARAPEKWTARGGIVLRPMVGTLTVTRFVGGGCFIDSNTVFVLQPTRCVGGTKHGW